MSKARQMTETVEKGMGEREKALARLRVDLETVKKAAAEAEGMYCMPFDGLSPF